MFDSVFAATYIQRMARALAIDYGRRRIGLAVSDPEFIIVSRNSTIEVSGFADAIKKLYDYIVDNEITEIAVGYPLREDGSEGEIAGDVHRLVAKLKRRFPGIPVTKMDESYTSFLAEKYIHEAGGKIGDDKGRVDAAAASILLEDYLKLRNENAR